MMSKPIKLNYSIFVFLFSDLDIILAWNVEHELCLLWNRALNIIKKTYLEPPTPRAKAAIIEMDNPA